MCKSGFDEPTLADVPGVRSLGQIFAFVGSVWLLQTLLERRLISVFRPIVWAGDSASIYAQVCLLSAES